MKKVMIFFVSLALLLALPVRSVYADEVSKEIKAKSSILMCMDTGDVIEENNAYEHLSPASVTKIMSILLIVEAIDDGRIKLDDMVSASENAVSKGGSQIWLEVGEKMSVDDLLKAVIIASANDACTLLSEYVSGSADAFVNDMNNKIEELGLKNSHFENCTGLDDSVTNHYSCAYDLAVIATEVMKHDVVKKYSTVWLDSLRNGKTELNNTNKLINKYDGITGLKTGTTSNAGFCLCATATRDNMSLVSVVLGVDNSDDRFALSSQLLDFGFANYQLKMLELDKCEITPVKIKGGVEKTILPYVDKSQSVLLKKGCDNIKYECKIKKEKSAPVKKGEILGEIIVYSDSKKLVSVPLKADKDIKKVTFFYIMKKILRNI